MGSGRLPGAPAATGRPWRSTSARGVPAACNPAAHDPGDAPSAQGAAAERCGVSPAPHQAKIQAWLTEGLRLNKVARRLRAQGVAVSYSSLYRFAQAHCGFGTPAVTVRVAEPPSGEAA